MGSVYLSYWVPVLGRDLLVRYDPSTGAGWRLPWPDDEGRATGWAWKQGSTWYALRSSSGRLVFQMGSRQWPLDQVIETNIERASWGRRGFRMACADGADVVVKYWSPADVWSRIDLTYDALDEELDDFFVTLGAVCRDAERQRALLEGWSRAKAHHG